MPSILGSTRQRQRQRQRSAVKQSGSGKKSQGWTHSQAARNIGRRHRLPLKIIEEQPEQPKFGQMLLCLAIIIAGFAWNIKQGKGKAELEFLKEIINRTIEVFGRYFGLGDCDGDGDEDLNVSVAKDIIEIGADL